MKRSDSHMPSSCPSSSPERRKSGQFGCKKAGIKCHNHAELCTFLLVDYSLKERARFIYKATKQHALNLAKFVTIYKTVLLMQRKVANGGKERSWDTFIAGLVGGWFVFGNRNAVNEQVSPAFFLICA